MSNEAKPCPSCGYLVPPEMAAEQEAHRNPDHEFVCGATEKMTHEVCAICKADMSEDRSDLAF